MGFQKREAPEKKKKRLFPSSLRCVSLVPLATFFLVSDFMSIQGPGPLVFQGSGLMAPCLTESFVMKCKLLRKPERENRVVLEKVKKTDFRILDFWADRSRLDPVCFKKYRSRVGQINAVF